MNIVDWLDRALALFTGANPDVQAALIGNAGIAATTLLTLLVTAWVTVRQLRHQQTEKAKDRALEVKKEIVIDGLRGAIQTLEAFSQIGQLDSTASEAIANCNVAYSKILTASTVAGMDVVLSGKSFTERAGPIFLYLVRLRNLVDPLDATRKLAIDQRSSQHETNVKLLEKQLEAELDANHDLAKRIDAYFKFGSSQHDMLHREVIKAETSLDPEAQNLSETALKCRIYLTPMLHALIGSIRFDLQIDKSTTGYLKQVNVTDTRVREVLDRAMRIVRGEEIPAEVAEILKVSPPAQTL